MAVCAVDDNCIDAFGHQRGGAVKGVGGNPYACSDAKAPEGVLACVRMQLFGKYVLVGDEAHDVSVLVDDREFFDLVLLQNLLYVGAVCLVDGNGDEVLGSHHVLDEDAHVFLETYVAVGDYSHQMSFMVGDGNASDVVDTHQLEGVAHGLLCMYGKRVADHSALGAFDLAHFGGLAGNAHILMNNPDSSFACKRYGHRGFCHGVHCGGHDGYVQSDVP